MEVNIYSGETSFEVHYTKNSFVWRLLISFGAVFILHRKWTLPSPKLMGYGQRVTHLLEENYQGGRGLEHQFVLVWVGHRHFPAGLDPSVLLLRQTSLHSGSDTPNAHHYSRHRWNILLSTLCISAPTISGATVFFTHIQHALKTANGWPIIFTAPVKGKINFWCHLIRYLTSHPTHLQGIQTNPLT